MIDPVSSVISMRSDRHMGRFFGAVLTAAVACQVASGQLPEVKKLEKTDGVVEAAGPGVLMFLDSHGSRWTVAPAPNARVSVVGQTTRDMLQKGQAVSCEVTFDDAGKASEPVKEVVFTGGGAGGVTLPGENAEAPAANSKKRPRGKRGAGRYVVSGPITRVVDDVITVMAGKERIEFAVAADATFAVNTPNVALASKGDPVSVEGVYVQAGQLQATWLEIKLANPVVAPPPRGKPRPKAVAP